MGQCYLKDHQEKVSFSPTHHPLNLSLVSMLKRLMLPSLSSGTHDEEHGFPHFKGEQDILAVSTWPPHTKT